MSAPKLRFKEFDRDWTTQSLGNVTDITKLAGYEFTKHINYQDSGEIIALRGLNVKGNNLVLEDVKYIDNSDLSMLSRSKLYIDDLLFTYVGTIGEVALIPENDKFYLAPNVCRIRRLNKNILSKYLMFLFSNDNFKKNQIDKYTTKSSQPALSMENIRKFEIVFPSVEEQTKIASFLSAVDEKISQLTQKHALLSQYKQSMMQKLFSQQIRFKADDGSEFGEWENSYIGNECKITTGNKDTQNKVDDGLYPFFVRSQTVEKINSYSMDCEAILTSGDGVGVGKNYHYINGKFDLHQRVYCLYEFSERLIGKYLYIYFSNYFYDRVKRLSAKNSVDSVRMDMISKMEIKLPCLEEQTKIANLLSAIDQKIEVVAQQIEQAKQWKKGLLQQMFI